MSYKSNKFKISAPTWNEEVELLGGSYSMSDTQEYFKYIIKNHRTVTNNPPIRTYVNKMKNRVTFRIETGYHLELLTAETKKLLGRTRSKRNKDENGENTPHLEITEIVLVHYNTVNDDYQQDSRVFYTFLPNKLFSQLLDISRKSFTFLKSLYSKFSHIKVWFTDQNSKPLEMEDKINITSVIN